MLLRDSTFDVIVLDMSLHGMDGFRLLRVFRIECPFSTILAVSGFMESFLRDIAIDAGVDAALGKPISESDLRHSVYRLIDPSASWQAMSD